MRKKRSLWLCLLLAAILSLSLLAGCGKGNGKTQDNSSSQQSVSSQTQEVPGNNGEEDEEELILYEDEDMQDDVYAEDEETAYEEEDSGQEQVSGQDTEHTEQEQKPLIDEDGSYTTKEDVALYIHTYGKLPHNFITKKEAQKLGWSGGSLEPYAPGKCIGGNHFGNYEGALPDGNYRECDIDTLGKKSRGAKRIIYSDDGRIYYTGDHYKTFEQLY